MIDTWTSIEAEIASIIAAETSEPFTPETISQAQEFLAAIRNRCPVPEVGKGYWSSIRFCWSQTSRDPIPMEVEVFGDRIEVYRFQQGSTDIRHVAHALGEPFLQELIATLAAR